LRRRRCLKHPPEEQKFFGSFFQKRTASSLPSGKLSARDTNKDFSTAGTKIEQKLNFPVAILFFPCQRYTRISLCHFEGNTLWLYRLQDKNGV
jgi:hypothetical protein